MNDLDETRKTTQEQLARQRDLEELRRERTRMAAVLHRHDAGDLPSVDLPADAHTYYGRIQAIDRTIRSASLADDLKAYARFGESLDRQPTAETLIARRFAHQIESGGFRVDLSQRYATDDPTSAQARHDIALGRLDQYIARAERLGYRVERGEAIAAALKHTHRLAIATGFGA